MTYRELKDTACCGRRAVRQGQDWFCPWCQNPVPQPEEKPVDQQPLGAATEHELLMELGKRWGKRAQEHMTRTTWVEAHHQILYAIGHLNDMKVRLEARGESVFWSEVVEAAIQVQSEMAALAEYARTGRGGTSAIRDHGKG